jgi:hypothetical protein
MILFAQSFEYVAIDKNATCVHELLKLRDVGLKHTCTLNQIDKSCKINRSTKNSILDIDHIHHLRSWYLKKVIRTYRHTNFKYIQHEKQKHLLKKSNHQPPIIPRSLTTHPVNQILPKAMLISPLDHLLMIPIPMNTNNTNNKTLILSSHATHTFI